MTDCGLRTFLPEASLVASRNLPPERYHYTAPEVACGAMPADAASDIYSVGCLLYHMLTGRPPFLAADAERQSNAHRRGRFVHPKLYGVELPRETSTLLEVSIEPDRSRRAGSYRELLSHIAPVVSRSHPKIPRGRTSPGMHAVAMGTAVSTGSSSRWIRTALCMAAAVVLIATLAQGSFRALPLLRLQVPARSSPLLPPGSSVAERQDPRDDPAAVTAIWNATDDLRAAYEKAHPHDTIVLKSPGPFLLDAIEITKPLTLRGAPDVRPLFLGMAGTCLRVASADVRLENLHFLRVRDERPASAPLEPVPLLEVAGGQVTVVGCSFQDLAGASSAACAIRWRAPPAGTDQALLECRDSLFWHTEPALDVAADRRATLKLSNCLCSGPGPAVRSSSTAGNPLDSFDLVLDHVTVYGSTTLVHAFASTFGEPISVNVVATNSLLVPRDRGQPILEVRYAAQPALPMPHMMWSGSHTVCPADALILHVARGTESPPWSLGGVSAWKSYWGVHDTGLLGVRMSFAATLPRLAGDLDIRPPAGANVGADRAELPAPSPVTIDKLDLLMERLTSR
jgi:hypothetical protein